MYIPDKLKSRKFITAMVAAVLVVLNDGLGWNVPTETVLTFAALVLGWIFSEAFVDGKAASCEPEVIYIREEDEI